MGSQDGVSTNPLKAVLRRSDELHEAMECLFDTTEYPASARDQAVLACCSIVLEHGLSLRLLFNAGCPTSAASLMRIQSEAVTRAIWLLYAATELEVEKLSAILTVESEQAAKNLATVNEMIADIGKKVGSTAPRAAHEMLVRFKDVQLRSLNSFVHNGIHSLRRHSDGFPLSLAVQIIQSSNAIATMSAMTLAILSGEDELVPPLNRLVVDFADCLPPLIPKPLCS